MRSAKAPLFGELADRLSMFLIRSDRARAGNNQSGLIALRRNGSGKKNDSGSAR
jgi:hypothetical protein